MRGFWLNGQAGYLQITNLMLHHTFTITFWIRIQDGKNIYSISKNHRNTIGQEDFFNLELSDGHLHFRYLTETQSFVDLVSNEFMPFNTWSMIALTFSLEFGTNSSAVKIFLNSSESLVSSNVLYPFMDDKFYQHLIGAELDTNNQGISYHGGFLKGFVYHFCTYTYAKSTFHMDVSSTCGPETCNICPVGPVCLQNCEAMQFLDGSMCRDCLPSCATGCMRSSDCINCADQLCEVCDNWNTCDKCVNNAELQDDICICSKNYYHNGSAHTCLPCYALCQHCTGPL